MSLIQITNHGPLITTIDAARLGIPRWMALAMPDDVAQSIALVEIEYHTPAQRRSALEYYLRELRRTQWSREPRPRTPRPALLRPSKKANGYRHDSVAHQRARLTITEERRRAIARKGASARWNAEIFSAH